MIESIPGGVRLRLFVQPKASKNEIIGLHDGALKIKIQAPPIEGRANAEIVEFLAETLEIPRRDVVVTKGETGRRKTVEITGLSVAECRRRLGV